MTEDVLRKWYSTYKHPEGKYFIIEEHPFTNIDGEFAAMNFYVFMYSSFENHQDDLASPDSCQYHEYDGLQDTLEIAKYSAFRVFGVPEDSWLPAKTPGEGAAALPEAEPGA